MKFVVVNCFHFISFLIENTLPSKKCEPMFLYYIHRYRLQYTFQFDPSACSSNGQRPTTRLLSINQSCAAVQRSKGQCLFSDKAELLHSNIESDS